MKDYSYEFEYDKYYCYPHSTVFKNKLNIKTRPELKVAERGITSLRAAQILKEGLVGKFDFDYLKAIHKFLFGDVYEWAGEVRQINISKGNLFCAFQFIEDQAKILFEQLKNENYLKDIKDRETVAKRIAYYLGEINAIHAFREGNGRAQRVFVQLLAESLGYNLDFAHVTQRQMIEVSFESFSGNYEPMEKLVYECLKDFSKNKDNEKIALES